jgi:hypothetical protein
VVVLIAGAILSDRSLDPGYKDSVLESVHKALKRRSQKVTSEKLCSILPSLIAFCLPEEGGNGGAKGAGLGERVVDVMRVAAEMGKADAVVDALVDFGMEHDDARVRRASAVAALRLVCLGALDDDEYRAVVQGVIGRAGDVDDSVVACALDVLAQVFQHCPRSFDACVRTLGSIYQELIRHYRKKIYGKASASASASASGGAGTGAGAGAGRASGGGGARAGAGGEGDRDRAGGVKHEEPPARSHAGHRHGNRDQSGGSSSGRSGSSDSKTSDSSSSGGSSRDSLESESGDSRPSRHKAGSGPTAPQSFSFGFVASELVDKITDRTLSSKARFEALALFQQALQDFNVESEITFRAHLGPLLQFLLGLVSETNLKISLRALQVLALLVEKAGRYLDIYLDELVPELISELADERIAIRHHTMLVFSRLNRFVGFRLVLEHLGPSAWQHTRWYVRENTLKILMVGLLSSKRDRARFTVDQLVALVGPFLKDVHSKVKYAAIEAVALIKSIYLDDSVDETAAALRRAGLVLDYAVESELSTRLASVAVPSLTSDGILEYPVAAIVPTPQQRRSRQDSRDSDSSSVQSPSKIEVHVGPAPHASEYHRERASASPRVFAAPNSGYPGFQVRAWFPRTEGVKPTTVVPNMRSCVCATEGLLHGLREGWAEPGRDGQPVRAAGAGAGRGQERGQPPARGREPAPPLAPAARPSGPPQRPHPHGRPQLAAAQLPRREQDGRAGAPGGGQAGGPGGGVPGPGPRSRHVYAE